PVGWAERARGIRFSRDASARVPPSLRRGLRGRTGMAMVGLAALRLGPAYGELAASAVSGRWWRKWMKMLYSATNAGNAFWMMPTESFLPQMKYASVITLPTIDRYQKPIGMTTR